MFTKKIIVTMIALGFTLIPSITWSAANPFLDVPAGHWAYKFVANLVQKGIIEGYGDNSFRGDRNITRYEAATILAKCLKENLNLKQDKNLPFSDVSNKHWSYRSVKISFENEIIKGYDDNTFRGDRYITRYEMAQMLANFLKLDFKLSQKTSSTFSDVPENHWCNNAVALLSSEGITQGYGDNTFRGDRNISRYEVAVMIAKAMVSRQ